jgi:uncharacterized protein YgiM (DUF1202 family)
MSIRNSRRGSTEEHIFRACMRFIAAVCLLAIMTSCSAAVPIPPTLTRETTRTARPVATHPATSQIGTPTLRPSCTVTAYTLNLRAGAGMRHAVKQILTNGERLTVIYQAGAWLFVSTRNQAGYIHSAYCRE